jgi:hypothetical protein
MSLHTQSNYPSSGTYVLKLHHDAAPEQRHLMGRLEHVASGEYYDFANGEQWHAWLVRRTGSSDPLEDV